jgi:hypothetical protein
MTRPKRLNLRDYPKWDDPNRETILYRRNRKIRNRRMRAYRSVPAVERVWYVTLTAIEVDRNQFGKHDLPRGLTFEPQAFWCRSRRKARAILAQDQAAGGAGSMYPVEYRHCPNCDRLLLGPAAAEYRVKLAMSIKSWHYPDGPACGLECRARRRYETKGSKAA